MALSLFDLRLADPRLAALARHPSSGAVGESGPGPSSPASFAEVVELLTGRWRVDDPDGFAAAVTTEAVLAGHPVVSAAVVPSPADRWTAHLYRRLAAGLAAVLGSDHVAVRAVSGTSGRFRIVEGRAEVAASPDHGPVLALAHLVEPRSAGHSWALVVVGDRAGAVAGVVRAVLDCESCPGPSHWARPHLDELRLRLLEESGAPRPEASVLAFPVGRAQSRPPMLGASSAP